MSPPPAVAPPPHIFVDESGDPGTSVQSIRQGPFFAFGFVVCSDCDELRRRLKRFLKRAHRRKRYPGMLDELKFTLPKKYLAKRGYTAGEIVDYESKILMVREGALRIIDQYSDRVFGAVVDKRRAHGTWTGENLGNFLFAETLMAQILTHPCITAPPTVIYDRGRLSSTNTSRFEVYLARKDAYFQQHWPRRFSGSLTARDCPSEDEPGLWAADMVAGALNLEYSSGNATYSNLLSKRQVRFYWH